MAVRLTTVRQSPEALWTAVPPPADALKPNSNCALSARSLLRVLVNAAQILSTNAAHPGAEQFISSPRWFESLPFQPPFCPGGIPKQSGVSGCRLASVLPRTCHS